MSRRVVITGTGVVSSLGMGIEQFWSSIKEGKNGISEVTRIDVSNLSTKVAAEIKEFDASQYIDKKEARRMDRYNQFAMVAAKMAVESSKLNIESLDLDKCGVIVGSGVGGLETLEEQHTVALNKGVGRVTPFIIPMMISNMAAGRIAIEYGFRGFNECVVTACATGNNAIGDAFKVIERGDADVMITGGAEACITMMSFAGFCSMGAMSKNPDPNTACRPFDKDRDGFIPGEGAAILIIEELEHALKRGANILAEIVGYGCTCDAYHITAPHPEGDGGVKSMQMAIKDADITPDKIGYINAHGTSTPLNDPTEVNIVKRVFGDHVKNLAMSSTKSMTGHLLGAAGAIEAVVTAMSLKEGFLPPTINVVNQDPDCDIDCVPNTGRKADIKYALSNSLGFGGHNATLCLKKYE